jgi:phenylacetate-CoA ligase
MTRESEAGTWRQWIFRSILIPLYEGGIKRRKTFKYLRELEASQWLPRKTILADQLESLRRLLRYATSNCPYYREKWGSLGLSSDAITSVEDFARWPLVDRDTIRENRQAMRSTAPGTKFIAKSTGGSSGTPLSFDLDAAGLDRRMAAWHRGYEWAGAGLGTKQWYLWGVPLGQSSVAKRAKDELFHRLYRRRIANCFEMSEERASWFHRDLAEYKPDNIVAYANPLYFLAQAFERQGLIPFSPKSIVVGAEKIHDFQRAAIERVFAAPVFETYGCREFTLIGGECDRHHGFHLTAENLVVEVVDDDGNPTPDGEEGNVVITDLTNYGMPFIRYVIGDRAIAGFGECSCGRGLPLLRRVVGRKLDVIDTPSGRKIPGEFFPHLLKEFPAVRRFQVVQESIQGIKILIEPGNGLHADVRSEVVKAVRATVGDDLEIELVRVDAIGLTGAGKLNVVVNRISANAGPGHVFA